MKASKIRGGNLAIAGVLVVFFLPMVGAITGTGQGIAYGQAIDPALGRIASAECVKLRGDLVSASENLAVERRELRFDNELVERDYVFILDSLVNLTNLRDQIAGLDAAAVFIATGDTRVSGLLQEMRKKAEARLTERKKQYESLMNELSTYIRRAEEDEAAVKNWERTVADLRRKSSAAGCDLPPLGSLISFLPAPSALGAPLPPARPPTPPPTTQVPGSVTRVPPRIAPGSLVLTKTEVSPPRDGVIGWGVKWQWAYTSTSATFDLTDIEDKPVVKRIHSSLNYALRFSGTPGVLQPGDTVTVTINGADTRTPIFGGGLDAYARQSGLEIISEKSCLVGAFSDGYHATCTGGSVYKVPPAATKVIISIWGKYGDPAAVSYTWERSR